MKMGDELQVTGFLSALKGMGIERYFYDRPGLETLSTLRRQARVCTRCHLSATRTRVVFGEGNPRTSLVFVGEAPGEEEDLQGRPFVGKAGKLLDRMIERIGLRREDVYICNVLKCRPPQNRDPEPPEVEACRGYLLTQLDLIAPRVICTLGRHAYNALFGVEERITRIRGIRKNFRGATLLPTYHPSFLLRNGERMPEAQADMEEVRKLLKG